MRKASKKNIALQMAQFTTWKESVMQRVKSQPKNAQRIIADWVDDVENRIKNGELGVSTQSLINSVLSILKGMEEGFYKSVEYRGKGDATFYLS